MKTKLIILLTTIFLVTLVSATAISLSSIDWNSEKETILKRTNDVESLNPVIIPDNFAEICPPTKTFCEYRVYQKDIINERTVMDKTYCYKDKEGNCDYRDIDEPTLLGLINNQTKVRIENYADVQLEREARGVINVNN